MCRDITKPSDRLPGLAGVASIFKSILGNDKYRFGTWMNDPASLLWTLSPSQRQEIKLVDEIPSWSWARYERSLFWNLNYVKPVDWTGLILAQCLDTPSSVASPFELHLRGPLVLPTTDLIDIHSLARKRLRLYETTMKNGGRACFMEIDTLF